MPFDAGPRSEPPEAPSEPFRDEPIDYVDWGMRILVFGSILILYLVWLWHLFMPVVATLMQR